MILLSGSKEAIGEEEEEGEGGGGGATTTTSSSADDDDDDDEETTVFPFFFFFFGATIARWDLDLLMITCSNRRLLPSLVDDDGDDESPSRINSHSIPQHAHFE